MADNRKIMIRLQNIDKVYRLGQIGTGSLRQDLQSWWHIKRGKEDPNSKIGQLTGASGERFEALSNINLTVYQGERLGIIGGNGAGKSTMLKLISRVTAPTKGRIDLYGRVTSMLEVGTGFHGEMTGRENIYMNGAILGMNRKEIDDVLEDIIDFSEVREFIDTPVKRYSSGMYVKLAFSVASHLNSEIVIMDEVLAVGDIAFQQKCIDRMMYAATQENRTILYVSHNMNTIRNLCSRCIVLDQGSIIYDGDVEEAIEYYSDYLMKARNQNRDLLSENRRDQNITGLCRLVSVQIENEILHMNETLHFQLQINSAMELKDAIIRLVISNREGGIVGMTFSEGTSLQKGNNVISCGFPTDSLASGGYVCDVAIVEFEDELQIRHDFARKVLAFQIEENQKFFGKKWNIRSWGNVKLAPLQIDNSNDDKD